MELKSYWEMNKDGSITCNLCGCVLYKSNFLEGRANFCPNCGYRKAVFIDNVTHPLEDIDIKRILEGSPDLLDLLGLR